MTTSSHPPIFILGVPRSGTTLLRTMLDSHPGIACGPETPWLGGHQPRSVMELCRALWEADQGYCASYNMPQDIVTNAARNFVSHLMDEYAKKRGKRRWAEKTPDNALYVNFLLELFPDGRYIHLVRDGMDVAASTSRTPDHRRGISDWHEQKLALAAGAVVANTPFSALLRWRHWNRLIQRSLSGHEHLCIRYEDLVSDCEATLRRIMEFIGEPYDPAMLRYAELKHDLPAWEWGTADVLARRSITTEPIGRARELTEVETTLLSPLGTDAQCSTPEPAAALASVQEIGSEPFETLMRWFNWFAKPLGLQTFVKTSESWEYPWLWFRAIGCMKHTDLRVVDLGSELSPIPWILALLGARVTLVEMNDTLVPHWESLRDRLQVDVDWIITDSERITVPNASVDLLTSFSVIEHQPDKRAAMNEAARILKPGGIFALSFDLVHEPMGMTYPGSHGEALTFADINKLWRHPAFGNQDKPDWNYADMRRFLAWHRRTSAERNYIVGAAVMVRSEAQTRQPQVKRGSGTNNVRSRG